MSGYDQETIQRLRWQYGDARAIAIVMGKDGKTNTDLAAWARLGGRTPTSLDARFNTAVKLVSQGYSIEDAAFMADVNAVSLQRVLQNGTRR